MVTRIPGVVLISLRRIWRKLRMYVLLPLFGSHGKNVWFDPDGTYSYRTITLGSDVFLGLRPSLMASQSKIQIGNKVMFGPYVTVLGGNHNTREAGRFMFDVSEKREGDDPGVVIEDDVWVGAGAVILGGVTLGRGSIVGAGSVVTKSVPPYSIVAGCPARVIRFRWDVETILRHEESLYSPGSRIHIEDLMLAREAVDAGKKQRE
jgi:acetyltransferase-like isoleucine patch superfamily enzyme